MLFLIIIILDEFFKYRKEIFRIKYIKFFKLKK